MKYVKLTGIILLTSTFVFSQGNYTTVNNNVYAFLERLGVYGLIDYSGINKPITRSQICDYLIELKSKKSNLTYLEQQELEWFLREYDFEIIKKKSQIISQYTQNGEDVTSSFSIVHPSADGQFSILKRFPRFHFFTYTDPTFRFVADPILGFTLNNSYKDMQYHRWNGINVYGSYSENWGFNFSFRDNWEKGDRVDRTKQFSNETGITIAGGKQNEFEYSEVNASITYETDNLILTVGKDFLEIGSGYRGKLIQSTKAPSFPFIRFDFSPVEWLSFNYFHGWLSSNVFDSTKSYSTSIQSQHRVKYRDKYIANHSITLRPVKGLDITLGESIIYSDGGLNILYLIPINFFRLADHYESQGSNNAGSNSQFFLDVNARMIKGLQFYSTLFIDELSISKLLKGETDRNQLGFTFGTYNYGTIDNLGFRIEYTRILPWVYTHYIPTQTYASANYNLGHYIGQNADQLFTQLDYRLTRGLEFKLWGEHIRRGGLTDIKNQYELPGEEFLYGLRRSETNIGFETSYEFLHDLFAKLSYQYSYITDEDVTRTPVYQLGANHSFGISLYYGL